jgi:hypothetical protein
LILSQADLPTKPVTIPEWKDAEGKPLVVHVRTLTADERDTFEREQLDKKPGTRRIRASLAAKAVVDAQGNRIFTDADIEAIGKKNGNAIDRLFAAVFELNKMSDADVKELEKN